MRNTTITTTAEGTLVTVQLPADLPLDLGDPMLAAIVAATMVGFENDNTMPLYETIVALVDVARLNNVPLDTSVAHLLRMVHMFTGHVCKPAANAPTH